MISSDLVISTEAFKQQWNGSPDDRSNSLKLFEQQFECEIGMSFDEWIEGAVYLNKEPEDYVLYQRGGTQIYQNAYDQVWVVYKISYREQEL